MTRKPLPKAIRRSSEDLRASASRISSDEEVPAPQPVSRQNGVVAKPADGADIAAPHLSPVAAVLDEPRAARRRAAARKIVEQHKIYAALGGLFPVPIVNVAGVTAIILRMVKRISDLYGMPFEASKTRSLIVGLLGGTVPTGLGAVTASTLAFAVPGPALFGLGVSAITAGALTRGIGLVFIESFEGEAPPLTVAEVHQA